MASPDSTTTPAGLMPSQLIGNGHGQHHYHDDDDHDNNPHSSDVMSSSGHSHHQPDSNIATTTSGGHYHHGHQQDEEEDEEDQKHGGDGGGGGRNRRRKRKLYGSICKQMEFYFSDANITKNRMMREIIDKANEETAGFVPLISFLEFTKIQQMTSTVEDIQKALKSSEKLELSEDGAKARRKVAFDPKKLKSEEAVEECTIYVENIPRESEHEWLEKIFQAFGPVAYISLPKFKSGHHKGFAFIEFDDLDAARRCVEAYRGEGCCLPNDIDPGELRSIQSFNEDKGQSAKEVKEEKDEPEVSTGHSSGHKRKADDDKSEPRAKRKKSKGESDVNEENEAEVEAFPESEAQVGAEADSNEMVTSSSKTKRKRKKNKAKKTVEAKLESESIMLKVLPKRSWRQLRNRYLNLQRSNMTKLKKQLKREYVRKDHYKNFYQPPQQSPYHHHHQEYNDEADNGDNPRVQLDHILEIKMAQPFPESSDAFRHKISVDLAEQDEDEALISGFIKFVDYKENEVQAFVRINGDESYKVRAENLMKKVQQEFSSARFLSAIEVEEYKKNVQAQLKQKLKEQPRKNVRGKDRLMKAATKSTHIRFDDDDDEDVSDKQDDKDKGGVSLNNGD